MLVPSPIAVLNVFVARETNPEDTEKSAESYPDIPFTAAPAVAAAVAKSILDCTIVKSFKAPPAPAAIVASAIIKSPILTCYVKNVPSAVTVYVSPLSIATFEFVSKFGVFVAASYPPLYSNKPVAIVST